MVIIPCHTTHARLKEIQEKSPFPILNMVEVVINHLREEKTKQIGILATDGTINEKTYKDVGSTNFIIPEKNRQEKIMNTIYRIKAGERIKNKDFKILTNTFRKKGINTLLLACTELSIYLKEFSNLGFKICDPLRIVARHLVGMNVKQIR